ncbi:hypothetical protein K435DRAFT_781061 [Dendrothele bispora CBS 962.96]|uniref:Uncharacterized protein n=1 Tax=Dendrothele bispora (strain CBS 962.96) TaxID=1314807 RepID=A0A4S8LN29_DENBC|nr:hypothetical protein K435DRAFT_781061 [Dendrothele bispora CBS 962.96]
MLCLFGARCRFIVGHEWMNISKPAKSVDVVKVRVVRSISVGGIHAHPLLPSGF